MCFLLYWYLPAVVALIIGTLIVDRQFTVGDIFVVILMGFFGWISMLFVLYLICEKYGDKSLINLRKKH